MNDGTLEARVRRFAQLNAALHEEFDWLTKQQQMGYAVLAMQRDYEAAVVKTDAALREFRETL